MATYEINNFDYDTKIMTFHLSSGETKDIYLLDKYPSYRPVHNNHYIDNVGDIVYLPECNRVIMIIDGKVYKRGVSQFEFDQWNYRVFGDDDNNNSQIYKLLTGL